LICHHCGLLSPECHFHARRLNDHLQRFVESLVQLDRRLIICIGTIRRDRRMQRRLLAAASGFLIATSVAAQDITPAFDPATAGQANALYATNKRNAERLRMRQAGQRPERIARNCADLKPRVAQLTPQQYAIYSRACH
jgi:hypothetical protein